MDTTFALTLLLIFTCVSMFQADDWKPTSWVQCRNNTDCASHDHCCSITPALGKRDVEFSVHYCLPYKNQDALWCELRLQFAVDTPNYHGLCPCGPGLRCATTDQLDPSAYPRDRFGKCVPV